MPREWLWVPSISFSLLPCSILFCPRVWNPPLAPAQKVWSESCTTLPRASRPRFGHKCFVPCSPTEVMQQDQAVTEVMAKGAPETLPREIKGTFPMKHSFIGNRAVGCFSCAMVSKLRSQRTCFNASITKNPYFHPLCQKRGKITSSLYTEQRYDKVLIAKEQMRKDHKNVLSESNS